MKMRNAAIAVCAVAILVIAAIFSLPSRARASSRAEPPKAQDKIQTIAATDRSSLKSISRQYSAPIPSAEAPSFEGNLTPAPMSLDDLRTIGASIKGNISSISPFDPSALPDCVPVSDHSGKVAGCIPKLELYPADGSAPLFPLTVIDVSGKAVGFFAPPIGYYPASLSSQRAELEKCVNAFVNTSDSPTTECQKLLAAI